MRSNELTKNSKMKDVFRNPIGRDVIRKILMQMGKSDSWINNPIVGNLKLGTVAKLVKGVLGDGFVDTLLRLLNSEQEVLPRASTGIQPAWWKEAVVYQIYPRSFKDSNGDGIGDLGGIIEKLDYLQALGVDIIWLSPIYDSPNDDNGYDIRDYQAIMAEFGTMDDFDRLLAGTHERGMKLIMDLVVNHTSDEHPWFQDSLRNPDSPYKDYYLWKRSEDENPPNNWTSFFSGPAWNYYPQRNEWAMHLFSKKQMDLNWNNPQLRADIYRMINWWLDKGIDGFRLDVINYISKEAALPEGNESIGKLMGFYGVEHYFYGPRLHEFLKEMRQSTFDNYDVFSVGETPGIGMEMSRLLTSQQRGELDMIFSFDHLETPGHVRFDEYKYDLRYLKSYYTDWMLHYGDDCWMTLFYDNHDNPRMISKVNPDPGYREVLGKLLAMIQLTLKGTPFLFQGQELGMVNVAFTAIDQFRDVESINMYHASLPELGHDGAFRKLLAGSRDHARTPVQWNRDPHAGFSSAEPWIYMDEDYLRYNVEDALRDPNSILQFYKRLISIRKANKALIYGDFALAVPKSKEVFAYYRELGDARFYVEINLTEHSQKRPLPCGGFERIASNYEVAHDSLRAYEANLYICSKA